jgi:hypothetical protein
MTSTNTPVMTLAEFERLLDVYGGDRTLWPPEARAAAAQLVARDGNAQRLLAEAEALDRVLERAPLPSLAREAALADRIVATARRSPRIVKAAGAGDDGSPGAPVESGRTRAAAAGPGPFRADMRKAALLAASLVAGLYIGLSSLPLQIVPALTGMQHGVGVPYDLALADPFDEDVL